MGAQSIYVASIEQPDHETRVTAGERGESCFESDPAWSLLGNQLAFLSDCETPGQAQLFVQNFGLHQQHPRQLTHLAGSLSYPQWSPDDQHIALLFVERASRRPNPMAAENRTVGLIDDLRNTDVQRLITVDVARNGIRQVTPPDL